MSRGTLDPASLPRLSLTGLSPSLAGLPRTVLLGLVVDYAVRTPECTHSGLGSFPFARRYSGNRQFSFSSSGYLDVSVHRVPPAYLWIQYAVTEVCSAGFPHSDICGSMDICSSPQLFAAYHVFHRLLVPRHPPCALYSLTCCKALTAAHDVTEWLSEACFRKAVWLHRVILAPLISLRGLRPRSAVSGSLILVT